MPKYGKISEHISYAVMLANLVALRRALAKANIRDSKFNTTVALKVYALYLANYLNACSKLDQTLARLDKGTIRGMLQSEANRLESAVQGLASGYIDDHIFRVSVCAVQRNLRGLDSVLKDKTSILEKYVKTEITSGKYNKPEFSAGTTHAEEAARKFSSFQEMADYLKKIDDISVDLTALTPKIEDAGKHEEGSDSEDSGLAINFGYGTADSGNGDVNAKHLHSIDKDLVDMEEVFRRVTPTIKKITLTQERPWSIQRFPLFMITYPPLNLQQLKMQGIKYFLLRYGIILENQLVLVLYNKYEPQKGDPPAKHNSSVHPVLNSVLFQKATQIIAHNMGQNQYFYFDPFSSKEYGKPYHFVWMQSRQEMRTLGSFKVKSIGFPYAPELKKAEDVTGDLGNLKREAAQKEGEREEHFVRLKRDFADLIKERNDLQEKLKGLRAEMAEYNKEWKSCKYKQDALKKELDGGVSGRRRNQIQQELKEVEDSLLTIETRREAISEVRRPALKDQVESFERHYHKFQQEYAKRVQGTREA